MIILGVDHLDRVGRPRVDLSAASRLPVQLPVVRHDLLRHRHRGHLLWAPPRTCRSLRSPVSSPRTLRSMPPRARPSSTRPAKPSRTRPPHRDSCSGAVHHHACGASPAFTAWSLPVPRPSSWIGSGRAHRLRRHAHRAPRWRSFAVRRRLRVSSDAAGGYSLPRPPPSSPTACPRCCMHPGQPTVAWHMRCHILAVSCSGLTVSTPPPAWPAICSRSCGPCRCEARGPDGRAQGHDETPMSPPHHHRGHWRVRA